MDGSSSARVKRRPRSKTVDKKRNRSYDHFRVPETKKEKKGVSSMRVLLIPSCQVGPGLNELHPKDALLRLERGLKLWRMGNFDRILVMGGLFNPPQVQTVAAAELMAAWLVGKGVSRKCILCETVSRDTYENIRMGLTVLRLAGFARADLTVVTQWQHALRIWITFLLGYGRLVHLVPMWYPIPWGTWAFECVFIFHHLLFPRGDLSPLSRWHRAKLTALTQRTTKPKS